MGKAKTKILYLCADTGIPFWGTKGGSIHMREFVKNLARFGYDITVVARGASTDSEGKSGLESVEFCNLPLYPVMPGVSSQQPTDKQAEESKRHGQNDRIESLLEGLYSSVKFDVIYERYALFSLAGLRFARRLGLPHLLEVNAPLIREASDYRGLMLKDLAEKVEDRLFSGTDHIIVVSDEILNYVSQISSKTPATVVINGVSAEMFDNMKAEPSGDSPLASFDASDYVIGFVGSLKPWHGVEILIEAFAGLPENGTKSRLLIVGGKWKERARLKQLCRERGLKGRVKFTGPVDHEEIPALLGRADVLVAPYPELEGFYFSALKIFEYMAAGKPVVASSIGQVEKILAHEKTALLVPPGDPRALGKALQRLKVDRDLSRKLGRNAREEAVKNHTWTRRMETISAILEDVRARPNFKDAAFR